LYFYLQPLITVKMKLNLSLVTVLLTFSLSSTWSQKKTNEPAKNETIKSDILNGLSFRSIGPAFMSGRISDIAIHPDNENLWYVTVGSGGVWKTNNAGTTWSSIFDGQSTYSIGCITLDPQNPNVLWVGTGENVGGRHIAYGDGVYRSDDGGNTWKHMGLKSSEHISKIIVHPSNSNVVWAASQGPLWSKGGERGVYKTIDGGKTWKRTLGDDEWVGATDLLIDPRNPNLLYAATWQRHRTVAGYMGGGPGTAIYRSYDGGETWEKLTNGLPGSNLGKIGMAISPQQPDVIYAAIELDRRKGGVYRSADRGSSWTKMSDAVSGGTGPHYYQELYACPHHFDRIYLADNYMQVSDDGGKTFYRMNENNKHVDNHAVAFKKHDPNYILVGCDGGLYESFDRTKTWKFIDNLPITQFYKVAVDDAEPFYNVFGGTQDNNTQGGPSRTQNVNGIQNSDWFVILGGDGHQPATEPGNPNIVYGQWQQGNLTRHDRTTGENVYIQPQPDLGEKSERYNWDAPILVSPHNPAHLFFASQRVWKSTDRGDSWTPISGDLTKNIERITTPFFGTTQSWDNPWDIYAMSNYSTITSLAESPLLAGLIYAGTDDGLIQVTEDGGANWRKVDFSRIPGLPATAFVNDIKADLYDVNTVYAVFDNHKFGDFKPYIYKSTDRGRTWTSLVSNLPEKSLLWRVVQDHESKNLMFLGSEFGVYVTIDGGKAWTKMTGGMPNISVRDLAIQKRENDLVLATFGRGFYILDDYTALRNLSKETLDQESVLYQPRKTYWYFPQSPLGDDGKAFQGDQYFIAENPPFGAVFTYYLKESYSTSSAERKKKEKESIKQNQSVAFPGWDVVEKEVNEIKPKVWLIITDAAGNIVNRVEASNSKGYNRVTWDLTSSPQGVITSHNMSRRRGGAMVTPGTYQAQLFKQIDGAFTSISERVTVEVSPLKKGHLPGASYDKVVAFWNTVQNMYADITALSINLGEAQKRVELMLAAYERASKTDETLHSKLLALREKLKAIEHQLNGSKARREVGEKDEYPTVRSYLSVASWGTSGSSYGPTPTHEKCLANAATLFQEINKIFEQIRKNELPKLEEQLKALGAPMIEGQSR
jgi:photosystem II stability/assembly factor-like uncharacterized protein